MWGEVQGLSTAELHLDIEALTMIAGYAHWIPITQGIYKEFFRTNYPDWEWNHIIPVLIKKGIVKIHSNDPDQRKLSQGLSISQDVESVSIRRSKHGTKVKVHTFSLNIEEKK